MVNSLLSAKELIKATEEKLLQTGFAQLSLKSIKRVWNNLEEYLNHKGISHFSPEVGLSFLNDRYDFSVNPRSQSNTDRLRAIQLLEDYQAHERIMIRRAPNHRDMPQPYKDIFQEFMSLRTREGISNRTLDSYKIYLDRFANYLVNHQVYSIPEIDTVHIYGFIQSCSTNYSEATVYCTSCALRVLFRYLYEQQLLPRDLANNVPSVKCNKKSKVPSAYSQEEIKKILSCIDRGNPKGKRDYAMVLIAARLGIRASDICSIRFQNIKWESNTIELVQEKTDERLVLPLLHEVGTALIDYIKYGRPLVDYQEVFLRLSAPIGPMKAPTLHSIVTHYMNKAGISIPEGKKHGPHALRHSLASALLNVDTPMPVIAEILGHSDTQTTATYLKIDILNLRSYALEVPPVKVVYLGGGRA